MEEILQDILRGLKCPHCNEYFLANIPMCIKGHSICDNCINKCKLCLVCKSEFGDVRNYTLEKLVASMQFECKNKKHGCSFKSNPILLRLHTQECSHTQFICPWTCGWQGHINAIRNHLKTAHHNLNSEMDYCNKSINTRTAFMFEKDVVYKICRQYDDSTKWIKWVVQYIGPKYQPKKFKINFSSRRHGCNVTFFCPCIPICQDTEVFDKHCVKIHEDMLNCYKRGKVYDHKFIIVPEDVKK